MPPYLNCSLTICGYNYIGSLLRKRQKGILMCTSYDLKYDWLGKCAASLVSRFTSILRSRPRVTSHPYACLPALRHRKFGLLKNYISNVAAYSPDWPCSPKNFSNLYNGSLLTWILVLRKSTTSICPCGIKTFSLTSCGLNFNPFAFTLWSTLYLKYFWCWNNLPVVLSRSLS